MGHRSRLVLVIIFSIALLIPTASNANAQRDPCEGTIPPDQIINLRAEQIGRSSTVLIWTMDFNKQNESVNHFIIDRSEDGRTFVEYDILKRVIEKSKIDRDTKLNKFEYLDEFSKIEATLFYRVKAGTDSLCYSPYSNIVSTFLKQREGYTLSAKGSLVEDRTPEPFSAMPKTMEIETTPLSIFTTFISNILSFNILEAFAQFGSEPLVTTDQDPFLESYLFALTPIPVPNQYLGFPCNDSLNVFIKKDQDGGQPISFDITLLDNQTSVITKNFISDNGNRPHNEGMVLTDEEAMSIDFYQALFVRIDKIIGLEPSEQIRALEIWEIEFLVPEDQGAC